MTGPVRQGSGLQGPVLPGPFVRQPPGRRFVLVPTTSRRAGLAGLSMVTTTTPRSVALQRAAATAVAVLGPRVLPGTREAWTVPLPAQEWEALVAAWTALLGPVDAAAVYERPQAARSGVALLLLRRDRPVALVKTRPDARRVDVEVACLRAAAGVVASARVPAVLGEGTVTAAGAASRWLALAPLPVGVSVPDASEPDDALLREVQHVVGLALPRPGGAPEHWRPAHGDLTPWNLRRLRRRRWLLDWEDAGWAPPGADAVLHAAVRAAVLGTPVRPVALEHREAVAALRATVGARAAGGEEDTALTRGLLRACDDLAPGSADT